MNSHQRRRLVRFYKEAITTYRVADRMSGYVDHLGKRASDYFRDDELALMLLRHRRLPQFHPNTHFNLRTN